MTALEVSGVALGAGGRARPGRWCDRALGAHPHWLAEAELPPVGHLLLVGSPHAARLRGAITGKNKSDVIRTDVLARARDVFDLRWCCLSPISWRNVASSPAAALRCSMPTGSGPGES